ncbi:PLD nuclease N-terminal domain-containing protein [Streptantibioticus ferralitis]|uniref:PLD nuclease N-terminal domain-containing protein n=1 Tax=Streptantibioticus ferralitis TaxID=236510 RepID=A0ABT5Z7L7_9ACTN|nr:PLD nuclease N-terminal domain-containing protein [Streptantibioticus ferralitis]MDF2259826.1 PLD nuclease N-terminal domain-containing protein [Streptantibioticus ferralitis]
MTRYLPFLLVLALWIYAFIDCLNTPEQQVRNLPKVVWVLIILLFGEVLIGPIAWLAAGRPRAGLRHAGPATSAGGYGMTAPAEQTHWVAPDDNPEFLRSLSVANQRDEATLKEWEADLRRREEELRRKQHGGGSGPDDAAPAS